MGALWNGKNITGLSYADELLNKKYQKDYITAMFLIGSAITFLVPLLFITVTKSWLPLSYMMLLMTAIALVICPKYIPESPKYLYTKG
jgi:hypothetical protein